MIWINNSFLEYLTLVGFHVKGPDCLVLRSYTFNCGDQLNGQQRSFPDGWRTVSMPQNLPFVSGNLYSHIC